MSSTRRLAWIDHTPSGGAFDDLSKIGADVLFVCSVGGLLDKTPDLSMPNSLLLIPLLVPALLSPEVREVSSGQCWGNQFLAYMIIIGYRVGSTVVAGLTWRLFVYDLLP
jgi:hypothetical protein